MSSSDIDLADEIERAWRGFRARLADRLGAMADDDLLMIRAETGVDEDELAGCAPYLQFVGWGGDLVRAETSSNAYLDDRFRLTERDEGLLVELGWLAPTYGPEDEPDSGSVNFHTDHERREADLVAVMAVRALREAFGCAHPVFLSADGLEIDPAPQAFAPAPEDGSDAWSGWDEDDETVAQLPAAPLELREMVDRAVAPMFDGPLRHDRDGDIAIISGSTAVWVRVIEDQPAVDIFSYVVTDLEDAGRAELEVAILNRSHPFAKFLLRDDVVTMTYRLCAVPFAPRQLRTVLSRVLEDVDDLARDLVTRVGGRRFFDPKPLPHGDADDLLRHLPEEDHSALVGLLEVLYAGPAAPASVAAMFDNDRHAIIIELVRLRTGAADPGEHGVDLVLDQLRAALRFVAEADAMPAPSQRLPRRPVRTHQLSLLPEPQGSLDLEESS